MPYSLDESVAYNKLTSQVPYIQIMYLMDKKIYIFVQWKCSKNS